MEMSDVSDPFLGDGSNNTNSKEVKLNVPKNGTKSPGVKRKFFGRAMSMTKEYRRLDSNEIWWQNDEIYKAVLNNDYESCEKLLIADKSFKEKDYYFHPLLVAAKTGNIELIKLLLKHDTDINVQNRKHYNALHLAIQQEHVDCCLLLIVKGIKFHCPGFNGNLAIHDAAFEGLLPVVQMLLDKGQDPNAINKKRETPIHLTVEKGHEDVLKLLIEKGGKLTKETKLKRYPLHIAALNGHGTCCEIILSKIDQNELSSYINAVDFKGNTPLILAAMKGHGRVCQSLGKYPELNVVWQGENNNTAMHFAAKEGFDKTMQVLTDLIASNNTSNVNIATIKNNDGNTPLHMAAMKSTINVECITFLLTNFKGNPGENQKGERLLHIAAINNCENTLRYLLDNNTFYNEKDFTDLKQKTPLHLAILNNGVEAAELLLKKGARDDLKDYNENIPLHVAAHKGSLSLCKLLLHGDKIKRIHRKNKDGATPMHLAAANGSLECCRFFYKKGAKICAEDKGGNTALHMAVKSGNLDIVKYLTKMERYLLHEQVTNSGDTVLHLTARTNHYEMCKYLVKNFSKNKILTANWSDNTPLDEAFDYGKDENFRLILSYSPVPIQHKKNDLADYDFEKSIHSYMEGALSTDRKIVQSAIVESNWWYSAFWSCCCRKGRCTNLLSMIQKNPKLVSKVFDRCVETIDDTTIYDFRLLEDIFFCVGSTTPQGNHSSHHIRPAFDLENGKLITNFKKFEDWENQDLHPLRVILNNQQPKLIQHPLVEGFWKYKWNTYLQLILYALLVFEGFVVLFLGLYLANVWNWKQIAELNVTLSTNLSCDDDINPILDPTGHKMIFLIGLRVILVILALLIFVIELNAFRKLKYSAFMNSGGLVRIFRMVGIIILFLPSNYCWVYWWIASKWQWLVGIIIFIISWFQMVLNLNEIPHLSLFMPITQQFMKSFFKVIFYIILILVNFAFVFHLLFQENSLAFSNIWQSFVKSVVWMLGDLGYDDVFVNDESPLLYPIVSNLIFIIFVPLIGGFLINMVLTQPADHLDSYKTDAALTKAISRIRLMLKYDCVFTSLRLKSIRGFWADSKKDVNLKELINKMLYPSDKTSDKDLEIASNMKDREHINKELSNLIEKVNELRKIISN